MVSGGKRVVYTPVSAKEWIILFEHGRYHKKPWVYPSARKMFGKKLSNVKTGEALK